MMNSSNVQYLSTTEFANRYNASMTIDKDHMPLEPSFVKLLCEQGQIEHSVIPAREGRKRDTLMIPEYELDKLDILLNKDKAEEPKAKLVSERTLLTTKDVAELLGCHRTYVGVLVKNGKLIPTKVEKHGELEFYKFDEDYILKFMETYPKRTYCRHQKPVEAKPEPKPVQEPKPATEDLSKFQKRIDELLDALNDAQKDIYRLSEKNKMLLTVNEELSKKAFQEPVAKDIFEAYRKGFKDGYEMGGGK